jgi:hypothetical protein
VTRADMVSAGHSQEFNRNGMQKAKKEPPETGGF